MSTPARITVFDTTLRDGEQAPGFSMDVPAKLAMARALDALGVDIIEAGFPIASPADSEAVRQIAAAVHRPVIAALARTRRQDIEEAGQALTPAKRSRIHTFLATSDLHLTAKLRMSHDDCLAAAVEAVASSLAALRGGVREVECSMNGIGERAGNASLEGFVMPLRVRQDRMPYDTAIDATKLFSTSQLLAQITDEPVQANKAIVGRNAFAHEAGIHQDGVLKDARTYEIMRPEDVGQSTSSRLVLGRHSGRHAVQSRCEALGFTLTAAEVDEVYHAVISLGEHRKAIADGDLRRIVERVRTPSTTSPGVPSSHVEASGYGHGV